MIWTIWTCSRIRRVRVLADCQMVKPWSSCVKSRATHSQSAHYPRFCTTESNQVKPFCESPSGRLMRNQFRVPGSELRRKGTSRMEEGEEVSALRAGGGRSSRIQVNPG